MAVRKLRIFISSPGDVGQERVIASRVLERLQGEFAGFVELEPILWEHEPLRATAHFQSQITTPSESDIVICILWSRLGTRLPAEQFRKSDGSAYASGTEWEFEDAVSAYLRNGTPDLVVYRKLSEPVLDLHDEQVTIERLQQKKALDLFIDHWFGNPEQGFKAAFHGFHKADEFEELLDIHLRKLIRERLPEHLVNDGEKAIPIRWFKGTPYRGLESFEFDHAPVFYGRTRAIGAVKEALIRQAASGCAFVIVFGMSGGGKSSLVRAGVIPTITHPGVIEGIGLWRWCAFRPSDAQQGDLFDGLAAALVGPTALPEIAEQEQAATELAAALRAFPAQAVALVHEALAKAAQAVALQEELSTPPTARLALLIDQMEELFTRTNVGAGERKSFITALDALARSGIVWVIATMRSDFYPRCAEIPVLAAMKEGAGQYDLLPPTFAEIGQMIRYPTHAAGLCFEVNPHNGEALDDVLHEAAAKGSGALPLLEFTLDELFRQRAEGRILTYAAYESLGGLEGALARRAEEVFEEMPLPVQKELPSVLRALITIDEDDDSLVVSRRVPLSGIASLPERQALVDTFVAARLLVTDCADSGEAVVRVAHEALIGRWPRVQQWLSENRDFLRIRARVADSEARWREEGKHNDLLLPSGKPLAEAEEILRYRRSDLDPEIIRYIETSAQSAKRLQQIRTRTVLAITIAFCILVLGFGIFSLSEARKAKRETLIAKQQRKDAEAARLQSELARHEAELEKRTAENQRTIAQEQTAQALRQKHLVAEQRQIAEVQRVVAERSFGHALLAANTMVEDVAAGVAPIAGTQSSTVKHILNRAAQVYEELAQENPTPEVLEGKARMLNSFVEIYLKLNDSSRAAASAREAKILYQALLRQNPRSASYQNGLARSEENLAKVSETMGSLPAAIAALRASQARRSRLLLTTFPDMSIEADIARTHRSLGSALASQGDRQGASAEYRAALLGWQRLTEKDIRNPRWREELAISLVTEGGQAWNVGDYVKAKKRYQQALVWQLDLVGHDPHNTELRRDLAQSYEDIASTEKSLGNAREAVKNFDRAITLARNYSALDPANVSWLKMLLDCQLQRADIVKNGSDLRNLRDQVAAVEDISPKVARLSQQDPANAQLRDMKCLLLRASGLARSRMAQLGESPRQNWSLSYAAYQEVQQTGKDLNRLDPSNIRWESRLMLSTYDIGNWYSGQGKSAIGLAYLHKAMQIKVSQDTRLSKLFPHDLETWHNLADDYHNVALLQELIGDPPGASQQNLSATLQSLSASERVYRYALAQQGARVIWRNDLGSSLLTEAYCRKTLADQNVAPQENRFRAALSGTAANSEFQRVLDQQPENRKALQGALDTNSLLSVVLNALGKASEAKAALTNSRQIGLRLSHLQELSESRSEAKNSGVSVSSRASSALAAKIIMDELRKELSLALPLYLAQPTTANYQTCVKMSLELAEILLQTPTESNLAEAKKTLEVGYAVLERIKGDGKLTPDERAEQEALQKTLIAAYSRLEHPGASIGMR